MGLRFVDEVLVETDDGVEFAVHTLFGVMVIPFEGSGEVVVTGICLQVEFQVVTVIQELGQLQVTFDGICMRGDVDGSIRIPGAVIGKLG